MNYIILCTHCHLPVDKNTAAMMEKDGKYNFVGFCRYMCCEHKNKVVDCEVKEEK